MWPQITPWARAAVAAESLKGKRAARASKVSHTARDSAAAAAADRSLLQRLNDPLKDDDKVAAENYKKAQQRSSLKRKLAEVADRLSKEDKHFNARRLVEAREKANVRVLWRGGSARQR